MNRVLSAVHKNGDLAGSQREHNAEISWKAPTAFVIIAGTRFQVDKIMKFQALKQLAGTMLHLLRLFPQIQSRLSDDPHDKILHQLHRAELFLIFHVIFGQWSFKKKCFCNLLSFMWQMMFLWSKFFFDNYEISFFSLSSQKDIITNIT